MPEGAVVAIVIAVLVFAAIGIGFVAWVAVQFGHRSVAMQRDFTAQLVNGLGVANKMGFAGDVMRQMGNVIDVDPNEGRTSNGRPVQPQHRVPDGFPSQQRAATAESR